MPKEQYALTDFGVSVAGRERSYNLPVIGRDAHPALAATPSRLGLILARPRIALAVLPSHARANLFGSD